MILYELLDAAVFGILRGSIIWWITTIHFQGKFPYIFQRRRRAPQAGFEPV